MYTNPNPNLTPQCRARKYGQTDGRTAMALSVYSPLCCGRYKNCALCGSVLGQDTSEPLPSIGETKDIHYVMSS